MSEKIINKITALGKNFKLTGRVREEFITQKDNFLALLSEYDPERAEELMNERITIKIEGEYAVAYRDSAVLG